MDDILTVAEVAALLKVSRWTIYNLVSRSESGFPHNQVGRYLRFRRSSVERWLEEQEKT